MENLQDILYVIGGLLLIIPGLIILFCLIVPILWAVTILAIPVILFVIIPCIILEMIREPSDPKNK
jgi:uncharacterized membrane protein